MPLLHPVFIKSWTSVKNTSFNKHSRRSPKDDVDQEKSNESSSVSCSDWMTHRLSLAETVGLNLNRTTALLYDGTTIFWPAHSANTIDQLMIQWPLGWMTVHINCTHYYTNTKIEHWPMNKTCFRWSFELNTGRTLHNFVVVVVVFQ